MQVNGLSGAGSKTVGIKMAQKMDSFSINIKNEIARKQKEQQEISSNKSLSAEEKMKKRQEIQRQINDLYNQLRQHQIEQRREKQQAEMSAGNNRAAANEDKQTAGLSQASMESMISADSAMAQAKVQGRAVTGMEGRIRGLKAEIRQDAGSGSSVKKKQEELEKYLDGQIEAMKANANIMSFDNGLSDAEKSQAEERMDGVLIHAFVCLCTFFLLLGISAGTGFPPL